MISKDTLTIADELAMIATNNNIKLTPRGETPLLELYRSCVAAENVLLKDSDNLASIDQDPADFVGQMSRTKNVVGVSDHDVNLEEITGFSSSGVATALSIARNQVNPLIKEITDNVKQRLEDEINNISNPIAVEMEMGTPLWESPVISSLVEKYKGQPLLQGRKTLCNKVEPIDFVNDLKTGMAGFDELVDKVNKNGKVASSIFYDVYSCEPTSVRDLLQVLKSASDEELILLHVISNRLEHEVPTTNNLSLDEFVNFNVAVKVNSAIEINDRLERITLRNNVKRLINSYPAGDFSTSSELIIRVNGLVYKRWLKEGGSPEILFGALLSDRNADYQQLLQNKEKYIEVWKRKERLLMVNKTNQSFVIMQRLLTQEITKEINRCDEEDYCASKLELHERLKKHINHMCADDINDIYLTVRHLICKVLFPHTDSMKILTEMDVLLRDGEVEDPKEAALFVTINYVTDWVADQITRI